MKSKVSQSLARNLWTLQRFGFSPGKVSARLLNRNEPRILCVSIPKAGTHLLERALCLQPRLYRKLVPTVNEGNISRWHDLSALLERLRPGQIIMAHLLFTLERNRAVQTRKVRCLFLIRDPRDMVVSSTFYILKNRKHRFHRLFLSRSSFEDQLRLAIEGDPTANVDSIGQRLDKYSGWLDSGCLVVRFEDLIGPHGGGSQEKQLGTLRSIYNYLGVETKDDWIAFAGRQLFSNASPTFRKGTIGQWKQYFDSAIKQTFKRVAGRFITQYGYETNDDW